MATATAVASLPTRGGGGSSIGGETKATIIVIDDNDNDNDELPHPSKGSSKVNNSGHGQQQDHIISFNYDSLLRLVDTRLVALEALRHHYHLRSLSPTSTPPPAASSSSSLMSTRHVQWYDMYGGRHQIIAE
jgi:hypothetical protein